MQRSKRIFGFIKKFFWQTNTSCLRKKSYRKIGRRKDLSKNEGLNHTGAHKITHCLGQALIAKRLGKTRLIAETGAGQHGVATATVAAKLGFSCTVYMEKSISKDSDNVF